MYARTDQLIAGLDRAVDPNDDGDAHDAARIALVPLAEPFAAFPDSPRRAPSRARSRSTRSSSRPPGTTARPVRRTASVSGPGGAPAALTVGAADTRPRTAQARLVVRSGLATLFAGTVPLAGAVAPPPRLSLEIARPLRSSFFSARGVSLVAGRAAFVAAGPSPLAAVERAVTAGASAVLLDRPLPAGGLGLDESAPVPVLSLPSGVARALRARLDAGATATVALGSAAAAANADAGRVASFSSTGLAFDGRVKPDLVAPGVALATSDPGANADGSPRFVTVNGSSAAAAVVAGAAALLAQARPALDATALAGLLVGTARALPDDPVTAQGSGLVDVGAAARRTARGGSGDARVRPRRRDVVHADESVRPRSLRDAGRPPPGSRGRGRALLPRSRTRGHPPGSEAPSCGCARAPSRPRLRSRGVVVARVRGGGTIRVPWAIAPAARGPLLGAVSLVPAAFAASDTQPALLTVDAGRVLAGSGAAEIRPLARLDVELYRSTGERVGLLARLRDVLPGRYEFGLTGRDPAGTLLPSGQVRHPRRRNLSRRKPSDW